MTKKTKEYGRKDEDEYSSGDVQMTLDQVVQNNNIMINVLTEVLLEKKIVSEEEIRKKLVAIFGKK